MDIVENPSGDRTEKIETGARVSAAKAMVEEVGWWKLLAYGLEKFPIVVILVIVLYKGPDIVNELLHENAKTLLEAAEKNIEAARIRDEALTTTLKSFREDELEDRRLFVELLRRSDITPQELQEAVEAASRPN